MSASPKSQKFFYPSAASSTISHRKYNEEQFKELVILLKRHWKVGGIAFTLEKRKYYLCYSLTDTNFWVFQDNDDVSYSHIPLIDLNNSALIMVLEYISLLQPTPRVKGRYTNLLSSEGNRPFIGHLDSIKRCLANRRIVEYTSASGNKYVVFTDYVATNLIYYRKVKDNYYQLIPESHISDVSKGMIANKVKQRTYVLLTHDLTTLKQCFADREVIEYTSASGNAYVVFADPAAVDLVYYLRVGEDKYRIVNEKNASEKSKKAINELITEKTHADYYCFDTDYSYAAKVYVHKETQQIYLYDTRNQLSHFYDLTEHQRKQIVAAITEKKEAMQESSSQLTK